MRRFFIVILVMQCLAGFALAQQDKLAGRWEGKIQSMQGERQTTVVFKKTGEEYSGKTLGLRAGTEIQLKDVKLDGDKVTAKADVETPQATLMINYTFTLEGEAMKGQGALDFNGQNIAFDITLKRVSNDTESPLTSADQAQAQPAGRRPANQQPQQKQSIDYFVGTWNFNYVGRESALGPAPREGTVTFTKRPDGKSVEGVVEGRHDGGVYKETSVITFDEAAKTLSFAEKLSSGIMLSSRGDWSTPISIRFTVEPLTVKGQKLQLRRTISIVSTNSFTVTEELSEDSAPFVRLGSAVFSRNIAK